MKRLLLAAAVLVALVVAGGVGNAAGLTVTASRVGTFQATRCSTATVPVTAGPVSGTTSTAVVLTVPAGCQGAAARLRLLGTGGPLAGGDTLVTLPAAGSTATVTVPSYTPTAVTSVALTLGTWGMATSWSYVPPPQPFTPGTSTTVVQSIVWGANGDPRCADVTITSSTRQSAPWRVDVNIAAAPFNGATTGYRLTSGQVAFSPSATPVNGVIGVVGTNNGWDNVSSSQTRTFTLCY